PAKTRQLLDRLVDETRHHDALTLVLALSYGAREEIVAAARSLAEDAAAGKLNPAEIDCEQFASRLQTSGIPDPDLLIRTSGEMRLSNFLLWQISYAELVILKKYWPDFRWQDLLDAVEEYQKRHRRFGAV
ncbi:MAG: polyprenyl diphosphate synthase, partial [Luteolibacter sp.]